MRVTLRLFSGTEILNLRKAVFFFKTIDYNKRVKEI